ncbi:ANTAR domain-containing protein [Pseudomaricurvus alkylphenolicus]|uniref:ANTAR domain-containing protein n=1 Tax=Pseudomaricurvus alkylphenolicus TaxID=1306991 RepID=UPI001422D873|nr:ANTAR domain-containing protein [Pseudomaricurvus alkylphenolicus]
MAAFVPRADALVLVHWGALGVVTVTAVNSLSRRLPSSDSDYDAGVDARTVLLLDADPERHSVLKRGLLDSGFNLVARLTHSSNLTHEVQLQRPDVLVIGIDEPDSDTLGQLSSMRDQDPRPVVMFAEKEAPRLIETVVKAGVNAFVVNDIQAHRLRPIISIAMARFSENQKLREELEQTKGKLAERRVIDRAKGMLMKHRQLSEDEAYKALRKMAMDKGKTLSAVAESIIDVLSLLETQASS